MRRTPPMTTIATMTARIANGGYKVNPTLNKLSDNQKQKIERINVDPYSIALVKQGMFDVVNAEGGTAFGSRFNLKGMKMAGKTGTTQVRRITMKERQSGIIKQEDLPWKYRNHALFVGYAPHDNPKYAVAVLVEHGGGGSSAAAPIGGKLLYEALRLDADKEK